MWLLWTGAESFVILGCSLLFFSGIEVSLVFKFFVLGTAGISVFLFVIIFLFTGRAPQISRYYPIVAWVVALTILARLVMFLLGKQ